MVDFARIDNTLGKLDYYLNCHENIMVSVSGGSDSDIIVYMVRTYFRQYLDKIRFVFFDTGLEYKATYRHLDYMEERHNIQVQRVRGTSVVSAIRKYGIPVLSKYHTQVIAGFCRDAPYALRKVLYPDRKVHKGYTFSKKQQSLAIAIKERGIQVSNKCCDVSKKQVSEQFIKSDHIDLIITGERKAEGGSRAISHKNCYEPNSHGICDKFMPLFFWNDETKEYYKQRYAILYSDCYEVWGFKRTGCVGCPFNSKIGTELETIKKQEPNVYKACMSIFGESYRLMNEFGVRSIPVLEDEK